MTTTTNLFSTDPEVLMHTAKVNGFVVLASATNGVRTFVLCDRSPGSSPSTFHRFVTWSIWRTEDGTIAAEAGDYISGLVEAVINLHFRAGQLSRVTETVRRFS